MGDKAELLFVAQSGGPQPSAIGRQGPLEGREELPGSRDRTY
jgi:hypothetical protein